MVRYLIVAVALLFAACDTDDITAPEIPSVDGKTAEVLAGDASNEILLQLQTSLSEMNNLAEGEEKMVQIPNPDRPAMGEKDNTAAGAPPFRPLATDGSGSTNTGYVKATDAGPDGAGGWYVRRANGFAFYYKTEPEHDLSDSWPSNVTKMSAAWVGETNYAGYRWFMTYEILAQNHVQGSYEFSIDAPATKYQGTRYAGAYKYRSVGNDERDTYVKASYRYHYNTNVLEAYNYYDYSVTRSAEYEAGRNYYGFGPEATFTTRPDWTANSNPAGADWTDNQRRNGLYLYQEWQDGVRSYWLYNGKGESCDNTPVRVVISADTRALTVGNERQMSAYAYNECDNRLRDADISWSSGDEAVASVDSNGLVLALEEGEATINAQAGDAKASVSFEVRAKDLTPARIYVSGANNVAQGSTITLQAVVYNKYNEELEETVTWSSSKTNIATVNSSGVVSGKDEGTTTIKATAGSVNGTRSVEVYDPNKVVSIYLSCAKSKTIDTADPFQCYATAYNARSQQLSGATFSWLSGNEEVFTVDSNGQVTPQGRGTAVLTVSSGDASQTFTIKVYGANDVSYLVISTDDGTTLNAADEGDTATLQVRAYNYDNDEIPDQDYQWTSQNNSIASVSELSDDQYATVTPGGSEGQVRITATHSATGAYTYIYLNAWDNRVRYLTIVGSNGSGLSSIVNLAQGGTFGLAVKAYNYDERFLGYVTPTWSGGSPNVSISESGNVTGEQPSGDDFSITASYPRGDGQGDATDTQGFFVYDADAVDYLNNFGCSGSTTIYTGNTIDCYTTARNEIGGYIQGASVDWLFTGTSAENLQVQSTWTSGNYYYARIVLDAQLSEGGTAYVKPVANCGNPIDTETPGCIQNTGTVTINAKGSNDIQYITISGASNNQDVEIGTTLNLSATAYDYQGESQAIEGVNFTWTRTSGSSFTVNSNGAVTADTTGRSYIQAQPVGGGPTAQVYLDGVDPTDAVSVSVTASTYYVRPYEVFYLYATATSYTGQTLAGETFTFTSQNSSRLTVTPINDTMASAYFHKCECQYYNAQMSGLFRATADSTGNYDQEYAYVYNPVYDVDLYLNPMNEGDLYASADTFAVEITAYGYNSGPASTSPTITLYTYNDTVTDSNVVIPEFDPNNSTHYLYAYAEDVSLAAYGRSNQTAGYKYYYVEPFGFDMSGITCSGSPAYQNGTMAQQVYPLTSGQYATLLTYDTVTTGPVAAQPTWTDMFGVDVDWNEYYDGFNWIYEAGVRSPSTGSLLSSNVATRIEGYIQFDAASPVTRYAQVSHWDAARVWMGGTLVYDGWDKTGANYDNYAKLTNIPAGWCPVAIESMSDSIDSEINDLAEVGFALDYDSYYSAYFDFESEWYSGIGRD